MMGNTLSISNDRNLTVVLNGLSLSSGEKLVLHPSTLSSTGLQVALFPKSSQSVIEIRSTVMRFKDGFCKGTRVVQKGELEFITEMETSEPFQITLVGAWASSYSSGVKITSEFILNMETPNTAVNNDL